MCEDSFGADCKQCTDAKCIRCSEAFFVNALGQCEACAISNCKICTQKSCITCADNHKLNSQTGSCDVARVCSADSVLSNCEQCYQGLATYVSEVCT